MEDTSLLLSRTSRYLLLHSAGITELGILTGKTGIALYFYLYSRFTNNRLYADYAGELIDDVYIGIHKSYPKNFGEGLCGIGWALDYLIRHGFIDADQDEVLEDIDSCILEWNVKYVNNYSLETGLAGIAFYVITRCANRQELPSSIPEEFIGELVSAYHRKSGPGSMDMELILAMKSILRREPVKISSPLDQLLRPVTGNLELLFTEKTTFPPGLDGYAGIGMKLIFENEN